MFTFHSKIPNIEYGLDFAIESIEAIITKRMNSYENVSPIQPDPLYLDPYCTVKVQID